MDPKEKWRKWLYEWKWSAPMNGGISREKTQEIIPWLKEKHIITVSGIRRSGKTTILFQLMEHLRKQKTPQHNLCYINFDNPQIAPLSLSDLDIFLSTYDEIFERNKKKPLYLFFDEIQNIPNFEKWIKQKYDKNLPIKFIVTGSSSALVSSEFSTLLTGRNINFTIYPFSFREYIRASGNEQFLKMSSEELWHHPEKPKLKKLWNTYIKTGGFYETFALNESKRTLLLQNYYRDMLHRGIIYRHEVRDAKLLEEMGLYLMSNIGNELSFHAIANALKSSVHTIKEYLSYFREAYIFFALNRNRKMYCIDHGLRQANAFTFSGEIGRIIENIVFIELQRRNGEIHYFREKGEIDFVVRHQRKKPETIQVFYSSKKMPEREIRALDNAPIEKARKIILTEDRWEKENDIEYMPVWMWLML